MICKKTSCVNDTNKWYCFNTISKYNLNWSQLNGDFQHQNVWSIDTDPWRKTSEQSEAYPQNSSAYNICFYQHWCDAVWNLHQFYDGQGSFWNTHYQGDAEVHIMLLHELELCKYICNYVLIRTSNPHMNLFS